MTPGELLLRIGDTVDYDRVSSARIELAPDLILVAGPPRRGRLVFRHDLDTVPAGWRYEHYHHGQQVTAGPLASRPLAELLVAIGIPVVTVAADDGEAS